MKGLLRAPLRMAMFAVQRARRTVWYFTRPKVRGVQAIALTPAGRVVLVKHRYARGWHLPGGGQKKGETAEAGILRELSEEIGLRGHGGVEAAGIYRHQSNYRAATVSLFLVRDVRYQPPWSLEIEQVKEFALDGLPPDTTRLTRARIAQQISLGTIGERRT